MSPRRERPSSPFTQYAHVAWEEELPMASTNRAQALAAVFIMVLLAAPALLAQPPMTQGALAPAAAGAQCARGLYQQHQHQQRPRGAAAVRAQLACLLQRLRPAASAAARELPDTSAVTAAPAPPPYAAAYRRTPPHALCGAATPAWWALAARSCAVVAA